MCSFFFLHIPVIKTYLRVGHPDFPLVEEQIRVINSSLVVLSDWTKD